MLIYVWIVGAEVTHGGEIIRKVPGVVESIISEAPGNHSPNANKVMLKISFPKCTNKSEDMSTYDIQNVDRSPFPALRKIR